MTTKLTTCCKWWPVLGLAGLLLASVSVQAASRPPASAPWAPPQSAIVVDAGTGQILHSDRAAELRHPASLTKLMTLYLTFEALQRGSLRLDQSLPVSVEASERSPTKLGLPPGSRIEVEEAVMGLVTRSANDAATVLAEALAGSEDRFAQLMTAKARRLGMQHTVFRNASGLPDDQQMTTAYDMAILSHAMLRDFPQYYPYFNRAEFVFRGQIIRSHNRMLSSMPGVDGLKTGFVRASGFNIATSAARGNTRLIGVYFGGRTAAQRDLEMRALLDKSFELMGEVRSASLGNQPGKGPRVAAPTNAPAARYDNEPRQPTAKDAHPTRGEAILANSGKPNARLARSGQPREWTLQVGAYRKRSLAERQARAAAEAGGSKTGDAEIQIERGIEKGQPVFRARLTGFDDEREAVGACQILNKRKFECLPVGPSSAIAAPRTSG